MKKVVIAMCVIIMFFVCLLNSNIAEAIDCAGTVTSLSLQLDTGGVVTLSLSGGPAYTYLCSIESVINNVPPNVCKTFFGVLTVAKLTGKKVLIRFHDYDSCVAVPEWGNAGTLSWTMLLLD